VTLESGLHLFTLPAQPKVTQSEITGVDLPELQPALVQQGAPLLDGGATLPAGQTSGATDTAAKRVAIQLNWRQWLLLIWAVGFALVLGASVVLMLQLRARLRNLGCEPGEKTQAQYLEIRQQMGIRGQVPILLMPDIKSPALTVEPFPRLLLPDRLIFAANAESMAFAMAHELMHYKRKDYLVCLLLLLLRAVYWFHPVSWALLHLMRLDMETACDSMVVARFDKARKLSYVNLLLALGEDHSPVSLARKVV
jgi:beta-lactamase regulating signal transducer with metallopeptidase domain